MLNRQLVVKLSNNIHVNISPYAFHRIQITIVSQRSLCVQHSCNVYTNTTRNHKGEKSLRFSLAFSLAFQKRKLNMISIEGMIEDPEFGKLFLPVILLVSLTALLGRLSNSGKCVFLA